MLSKEKKKQKKKVKNKMTYDSGAIETQVFTHTSFHPVELVFLLCAFTHEENQVTPSLEYSIFIA